MTDGADYSGAAPPVNDFSGVFWGFSGEFGS